MALRRSARNVKGIVNGDEASTPDFKGGLGTSKRVTGVRGVRTGAKMVVGKEVVVHETAASKKVAASRKRKFIATEEATEPLVDSVADTSNTSEVLAFSSTLPDANSNSTINGADNLPSTPLPKKRQQRGKFDSTSPSKPITFTPTPSGVGLIAGSANLKTKGTQDHMLDSLAALNQNRPAAPQVTNAPVLTPDGARVVVSESPSKKRKANDLPPDVGSPMKASSTIDTLLQDAEAYLVKVDRETTGNGRLEGLISRQKCKMFDPEGLREVVDPFTALASGIIGQQVSGAAAASIRKKFTALFEDTHPAFPSPDQVLTKDLPTLRTAGLSQRKAEYITGLAEKFASGEFTAEGLVSASDEELIEKLVAVRGLGRWSVEMFACFGLKRMDVFSTGDLGVQRGMAAYMGRDVSKLKNKGGKWKYMTEQDMLSIASKFSPYRSLFMWYMWRIADVDTEVLE